MSAPTTTTVGLKEWGAVVHALLQARQTVLLRKGGIHERAFAPPEQGDGAASGGVVLFPTVAHSHRERVRAEHADLLDLGEADVAGDTLTLRAGVRVVDTIQVARPEALPAIADLHIWTDASVRADRVDFRPKHALTVMVVQAVALPEPVALERTEEHGGCRSWLDLPAVWDGTAGTPALDRARLAEHAERVRRTVA